MTVVPEKLGNVLSSDFSRARLVSNGDPADIIIVHHNAQTRICNTTTSQGSSDLDPLIWSTCPHRAGQAQLLGIDMANDEGKKVGITAAATQITVSWKRCTHYASIQAHSCPNSGNVYDFSWHVPLCDWLLSFCAPWRSWYSDLNDGNLR